MSSSKKRFRARMSGILLLAGAAAADDFQVNSHTTDSQYFPDLAFAADGGFVVVWISDVSPSPGDQFSSVLARRFAVDGTPLEPDFVVNLETNSFEDDTTVDFAPNDEFVVSWTANYYGASPQVHSRTFAFDALAPAPASPAAAPAGEATLRLRRDLNVAGHPVDAYQYAAEDAGSFSEIFSAGLLVNTYTTGDQSRPDISQDDAGNFVVVWRSSDSPTDSSSFSVQARRYSADDQPLGDQFQVNTLTTDRQIYATIAHLAEGSFVVVWTSEVSAGTDTDSFSIQARLFAADGTPAGPEFQVNTYTTGYQRKSHVAADDDGNFVVVWTSNGSAGSDTDDTSVQARRFSASGAAIGPQFQVNQWTTSSQGDPRVAVHAGEFMVVWEDWSKSGDELGGIVRSSRLPLAGLFADGFEIGSTVAWSQSSP